jgi:hypothetical protein
MNTDILYQSRFKYRTVHVLFKRTDASQVWSQGGASRGQTPPPPQEFRVCYTQTVDVLYVLINTYNYGNGYISIQKPTPGSCSI